MRLRYIVLWLIALLVLAYTSLNIYQQEERLRAGRVIFLELAPADPRSLFQGDYMRLRYSIADAIQRNESMEEGRIVARLDPSQIAHYDRSYTSYLTLNDDQIVLRYHRRGETVVLDPDSFLFQEGHATYYANARYAELRVFETGDMMLIGLRGPELEKLGPLP